MKKSFIFILLAFLVLSLAACGMPEEETLVRENVAGYGFIYENEGCGGDFEIILNSNGTVFYYEGPLSSHMGSGVWKIEDNRVIISEIRSFSEMEYRFYYSDGALVFDEGNEYNFTYLRVKAGEKFIRGEKEPSAE